MKIYISAIVVTLLVCVNVLSQSVGIGEDEFIPHVSAALELRSNDKGLLIPRMSPEERNAIERPAIGLLVYQTGKDFGFFYFDGINWQAIGKGDSQLQTISISGDTISLSMGGYVVLPEIAPGSDEQRLKLSGDSLFISNGNYVLLTPILDNLGNHTATQNVRLNTFYLSADGDKEGLRIGTNGDAEFSHNIIVNGTTNLGDLNVGGTVNLGVNAIQSAELSDNAVINSKINNNAVTTSKVMDAQITAAKLHPMGASTDQVLRYNGTSWAPASISSGLSYLGTWNAATNTPAISISSGVNGNYYIVSVAGLQNLGSGPLLFDVGDWAIYNGSSWQVIKNSSDVNSVFGRTGTITAQYGDYFWNQIDMTDSDIDNLNNVNAETAGAGYLLIGDGSSWNSGPISGDISLDGLGNMVISDHAITYNHLQNAVGAANNILQWNGTSWEEVMLSSIEGDADPTNELQSLVLSNDLLSLSNDGIEIDLGLYLDNVNQTLSFSSPSLTISDGNSVDLSALLVDVSDSQTITLTGNLLSIENGNGVPLDAYLDNTDQQNLSLTSNILSIDNGNSVPLNAFLDNTDQQNLSLTSNVLSIDNGNSVPLDSYLDNTDQQNLSLLNDSLSIENGNSVYLGSILNTDAQDLSLTGTTLSLTNDPTTVDLSGLYDNLGNHTATQNIALNDNYLSNNGGPAGIRINNAGQVAIGNSAPQSILHLESSEPTQLIIESHSTSPNGMINLRMLGVTGPVAGDNYLAFSDASGATLGSIEGFGTGVLYSTASDKRLKENISDTRYGLNDVLKINVCDYNFIGNSKIETGFVAQDLYTIYPIAVNEGGSDPHKNPWTIDYGKITPLLTIAIQQLNIKVDSLQYENEQLKAENKKLSDKLETRIVELENKLNRINAGLAEVKK